MLLIRNIFFKLFFLIAGYLFVYSSVFNIYILGKQFLFTLLSGLTFYWITSIFIFLINTSYFKGVPTSVTRFWRRGIMLFWGIELFLCSCYLFVILNCAVETEWMARQNQLFLVTNNIISNNILSILSCVFLICWSIVLMRSSNSKSSKQTIIIVILYIIIVLNTLDEFYQFFYHVSGYSQYQYSYDLEDMVWDYSSNNTHTLVLKQYYFTLVFLKFWHAFLVYSGFAYTLRLYTSANFKNFNLTSLKLSVVNLNFLLIFALLPYLYSLKLILQIISSYTYFWFGLSVTTNLRAWDLLLFFW